MKSQNSVKKISLSPISPYMKGLFLALLVWLPQIALSQIKIPPIDRNQYRHEPNVDKAKMHSPMYMRLIGALDLLYKQDVSCSLKFGQMKGSSTLINIRTKLALDALMNYGHIPFLEYCFDSTRIANSYTGCLFSQDIKKEISDVLTKHPAIFEDYVMWEHQLKEKDAKELRTYYLNMCK